MLDKETEKKLIAKAFEMKEKAYCPYSKYHVLAGLLTFFCLFPKLLEI